MKHWFIGCYGGLLAILFLSLPLYADQHINVDGHVLTQIEIVSDGQNQHLVIYGSFSPDLLSSIQVIQGEDPTQSMIAIPYGLVNTMELPATVAFQANQMLDFIEVEEIVEESNDMAGDLQFQVNLYVVARQPTVFSFEPQRTNQNQVAFLLVPKGAAGEIIQEVAPIEPEIPDTFEPEPIEPQMPMDVTMAMAEPENVLLHPVSAMMVFQRPSVMHLSILNASPRREDAQRLAILLDRHQRQRFETNQNMKLDITNISSVQEKVILNKTKIYFRPNFLSSALTLAELIPGEQIVEEMPMDRRGRLGLDVEIYVGANFE